MLSILYIAGLIVCVAAILLTALLSILKKKAVVPLILYALCVMLILGVGFVFPDFALFPETPAIRSGGELGRSDTSTTQPVNQDAPSPVLLDSDAPDTLPGHTPEEEQQENQDAAPEPTTDTEPTEPETKSEPVKTPSPAPSKPAASKPASTSDSKPASDPAPAPAEDPAPVENPMPAPVETPASDEDPSILPDTEPTLTDDPASSPIPDSTPSGDDNTDGSTGGTVYLHSFTNGILLGSMESNRYHCKNCPTAKKIPPADEIWFTSPEDAQEQGYQPCGSCYE